MATAGDADVEMMMAMEMELEGMDWEALLSGMLFLLVFFAFSHRRRPTMLTTAPPQDRSRP